MTSRPARLLIYESYAFQKVSGELRTVLYLLRFLDRSRLEPVVAVPFMVDGLRAHANSGTRVIVQEPPARLRAYGGAVTRRGLLGRALTAWDVLKYARQLARLLRAERIDVVYCCSLRAMLLVGLAARLTRTPVLFYVNSGLQNPVLDTLAFAIAQRVVFQCAANRDDRYPMLRRWFRRKLAVVPSGLDIDVVRRKEANAPAPESLGVDASQINLIVLGFLNPEKGIHHLIEALASLGPIGGRLRLWVVGDQLTDDFSDYRSRLERLIQAKGLGDVVELTGWRADAFEFLTAMDILVHPSLTEGMPRAVLEAMALGKTVVATSVGCCREVLVHDENGLLVPPGDAAALASALARVVDDSALRQRLGAAAAATMTARYDIRDKVRSIETLLAGLAQGA